MKHYYSFAITDLREVLKMSNTVSRKFNILSVHILTDFSSSKIYEIN